MALVIHRQLNYCLRTALAFSLALLLLGNNVALALTADQKRVIQSGVQYFNVEQSVRCSTSVPLNLAGNDNQEKIYRYFVSQGLTPEQSAGITGNAYAESTYNPLAESKNYRGVFQWSKNSRWPELERIEKGLGRDPNTLEAQLDFAWYEANGRKTNPKDKNETNIDGVRKYTDIDHVAWYWGRYFEVAFGKKGSKDYTEMDNVQHLDRRIAGGHDTYAKYGPGGTPSSPNSTGPAVQNTESTSSCSGTGYNTVYANGFTFYSQYDPQWKDKKFGNHTIAQAGCGPTTMAMIITNLTKNPVTPDATAAYATEKKLYQDGGGSTSGVATELAAHWGLKAEPLAVDVAAITVALRAGKLVFLSGNNAVPFTKEGHIIGVRAATAEGKWLLADPAFELRDHAGVNEKEWDPNEIIVNVKPGMVYAISK